MLKILKQYESDAGMLFEDVVLKIINDLGKISELDISKRMEETEAIREPNVEEIPKIGEVHHNLLIVVPEPIQVSSTVQWPGVPMEKISRNWYAYTFKNVDEINVIFNNNQGTQTPDLLGLNQDCWYDWTTQSWLNKEESSDLPNMEKRKDTFTVYCKVPEKREQSMIYFWNDKPKSFDEFIKEYKDKYYPEASIISEHELENVDISNRDLVVFGTLKNSKLLAKLSKQLPVFFTNAGDIVADRLYRGEDLIFISAWIHPDNPQRVMELYIAKDMNDLINIDWVPRGGTNYHITRGLITLRSGNYHRRMKIWRF
jgi:Starch-binding module 26